MLDDLVHRAILWMHYKVVVAGYATFTLVHMLVYKHNAVSA